MEANRQPVRLPSIDGWRAVSITIVLVSHAIFSPLISTGFRTAIYWCFDGNLGVRFFFVISGYLITRLLIQEYDRSGRVDLRRFYVRRFLRILPVYYAFLGVLYLLQCAGVSSFHRKADVLIRNLTFTTNFGTSFDRISDHLWSLAVEEQFYLIWPVMFVWLGLARNRRAALVLSLVPLAIAPISRAIDYKGFCRGSAGFLFHGWSFFNYFDSIALGCACALIVGSGYETWLLRALKRTRWTVVALGLVIVPHILTRTLLLGVITVPFGSTLQAVGMCFLLVQSVEHPDVCFYRILNLRGVAFIGVLSYSIYIWQQLFFVGFSTVTAGSWVPYYFPLCLISTFAAASVSHFAFERPLMSLRSRLRS